MIERLRDSGMTISYHFRPPHPAYSGFDAGLRGLDEAALRTTLRYYETFRLDLATGGLDRSRPGGYAYVKQMLGTAPVTVSALGNPRSKTALLDIYRELGARMTMEYHESGTAPDQPFAWRQGLLDPSQRFQHHALGRSRGVAGIVLVDPPRHPSGGRLQSHGTPALGVGRLAP